MAPWATAGSISSVDTGAVMRSARPSRRRPAQASSVASAAPSASLRSRVSTLPRKRHDGEVGPQVLDLRLAPQRGGADHRALRQLGERGGLGADEGVAHVLARQVAGDARGPPAARVGMSFMECTARSISPASSASSISLVKRPLPPASASGRSWMRSPEVLMARTSNVQRPGPCAASRRARTSCACASASGEPRVPMRRVDACKGAIFRC